MFDRVVVVSLERRPDRLAEFMARVPKDFPFGEIETYKAVDGRLCKHPRWWRQGGGAWGCYRSHVRILEECLNAGQQSVLIFEDDATFCDNFKEASLKYLDALPQGWIQAYFGGQHLKKAIEIPGNPLVVKARDINRTHAFAINTRAGMITVYKWLNETKDWTNRNHIDHHLGQLHKRSDHGYYAPAQWLCGQAEGRSDISGKESTERWWLRQNVDPDARDLVVNTVPPPQKVSMKFFAVMGLHRSGSSCIAMVCHKLGLSMGDKIGGFEAKNGGGGEAIGLANLCEWAAKFPSVGFSKDRPAVEDRLRKWIQRRVHAGRVGRFPVGGKYPHLCAMGSELKNICGDDLRIIHCDRPLDQSIDSLQRRSKRCTGWLAASDEQCELLQKWLWNEKQKFLATMPADRVLNVNYNELVRTPEQGIQRIIDFAGLKPTEQQRKQAIAHIKKPAG